MSEVASVAQVSRFEFTGSAGAYFRIWIVSLCLALLTLGAYSAWGKVRKRRYLYAHTRVDGDGFDYRASPLRILKGRVIAVALFGGVALAGHFEPLAQFALVGLFLVLLPWLIVASARFNARNTTWRGIAFGFDGSVGQAANVLYGVGVLVVVTFGLAWPYYRRRRATFIVEHHRYGSTRFDADFTTSSFIAIYLLAGLMLFATIVLSFVLVGALALTGLVGPDGGHEYLAAIPALGIYAAYLAIFAFVSAGITNATFNGTVIGPLRLHSTLGAPWLAWLYLTNAAAIVASLGLATAWATVRVARYRALQLSILAAAPLASLLGAASVDASATGGEVSDLFDVDVSL